MEITTKQEMDSAAERAASQLAEIAQEYQNAIIILGEWWDEWYLKAGHKRLGRVLLGQYREARDG